MEKSGNSILLKKKVDEIDQKQSKYGDLLANILDLQGKYFFNNFFWIFTGIIIWISFL